MYLYHGSTESRLSKLFSPDEDDMLDGYRPMVAVDLYLAPNMTTAIYHARVLERQARRRDPEARGVLLTLDSTWLRRYGQLREDVMPVAFTTEQREAWHRAHPEGAFVYSGPIGPYSLVFTDELPA